jgi:hypothetical protein
MYIYSTSNCGNQWSRIFHAHYTENIIESPISNQPMVFGTGDTLSLQHLKFVVFRCLHANVYLADILYVQFSVIATYNLFV